VQLVLAASISWQHVRESKSESESEHESESECASKSERAREQQLGRQKVYIVMA